VYVLSPERGSFEEKYIFGGINLSEVQNDNNGVPDSFTEGRAFTFKSLLAGFIGLAMVSILGLPSVELVKTGDLLACHLGVGAYFYFFLLVMVWNPLVGRFIPALHFRLKELVVVMIMTLTAGGFSYVGWMRQMFTQTVLLPIKAQSLTDWKRYDIFSYFNPNIFPNKGIVDDKVMNAMSVGPNKPGWINFFDVPWAGWHNIIYWGPVVILISFMMLGMLMLVHKQWIKNEKLSYPLATIAEMLIYKSDKNSPTTDLFKSKLFWGAFAFVMFIHMYNYTASWWPQYIHAIPLQWGLDGINKIFPTMNKTGSWSLFGVHLYFMIFGIAYFLSSALSLTVGLNAILYFVFAAQVYFITGSPPTSAGVDVMRAGAYLAFAVMLLFLGRHFYGPVMMKALFIKRNDGKDKESVFAARMFLTSFVLLNFVLTRMGFDLFNALAFSIVSAMMFLVLTRIVCESGIPFIQGFMPVAVLPKLFGGGLFGPSGLMLNGLLSGVFCFDVREILMPYMATGAKMGEDAGIKRWKFFTLIGVSIVIAFVLAFVFNIWEYYSYGVKFFWCQRYGWNIGTENAVNEITKLDLSNQLKAATGGLSERLSLISWNGELWSYFIGGFLAVVFFSFLRIRFLWWPIHGLLFCIWHNWPSDVIWSSFLFGWIVRTLVVKYGGERNYMKLKPLFVGLIFGEICAIGVIMLFAFAYYVYNGQPCPYTSKIFIS